MLKELPVEKIPRILIFFSNINQLADAYQFTVVSSNQLFGQTDPIMSMFHRVTSANVKRKVLYQLADKDSRLKVVFCSSSLSMGMNLAAVEYVVHYGPSTTTDAFIQETGRAAREAGARGHSILMTFPRMSSGRSLDPYMKQYIKDGGCLREILLKKFDCQKPDDQPLCCDSCQELGCIVKTYLFNSMDSSATDTYSDSDSVASVGEVENLADI